ncbi:type VI secretion system contractile sheath small subunit [Fundidesulfovibrio putealis]|uniref:type VI secretion system contractile sheath small subunit n=1 Tax=Fundidesulfovibrio putealis TaxID=270496 RepID=UPI00042193D7|nr:type VI secretion system contractile sheath small subunit [Fundidesulfovibrio putealis]
MAQEASVAPKERVNIVYKPATGDAKEEIELPLKLLVLGDFVNRADDRTLENREPISVDKDNFDDVLKAQKVELNMTVANKVSGKEGEELGVHLGFNSLKDFEPDAIAAKVPELQKLMELREALKALKGPLANVPEFRKKVQDMVQDPGLRDRLLKELGLG